VRRLLRARGLLGSLALWLAISGLACAEVSAPESPAAERLGPPVVFSYGTTSGGELSSGGTRGRATAVLFVTTYDLSSQIEAKRLDEIVRRHRPRANAGAVVLEQPKYAVLADAFRSSLGLGYEVALADAATLAGQGPFGKISHVPTLFVLDRAGRLVWHKSGLATPREIERALAAAASRGSDR
jgi:hypothetical protein